MIFNRIMLKRLLHDGIRFAVYGRPWRITIFDDKGIPLGTSDEFLFNDQGEAPEVIIHTIGSGIFSRASVTEQTMSPEGALRFSARYIERRRERGISDKQIEEDLARTLEDDWGEIVLDPAELIGEGAMPRMVTKGNVIHVRRLRFEMGYVRG